MSGDAAPSPALRGGRRAIAVRAGRSLRSTTAYAITYTSKTGQTALWQGASLELADIDDDIADANGEIDPDRIPEAPQPECPTGGCARDRAKAEAAKEEL